jgi:Spy/CpxP family protein refolding chaperone
MKRKYKNLKKKKNPNTFKNVFRLRAKLDDKIRKLLTPEQKSRLHRF